VDRFELLATTEKNAKTILRNALDFPLLLSRLLRFRCFSGTD